jgi:eukaryotic-like serine/threonine-protein kinase
MCFSQTTPTPRPITGDWAARGISPDGQWNRQTGTTPRKRLHSARSSLLSEKWKRAMRFWQAKMFAKALSLAPSRAVKVVAALVLAKSGDGARANEIARELENKNPLNTLIRYYWLPTLKASLEVHAGNPQTAVSLLQTAIPYELSQASVRNAPMYSVYIRGQAYLLEHNGSAAAAEFRKVLEHRGIVQNSTLGALSLLQIARADVMMGDLEGARKQYGDFLLLWKNADPDVPILQEAKAESAKLK